MWEVWGGWGASGVVSTTRYCINTMYLKIPNSRQLLLLSPHTLLVSPLSPHYSLSPHSVPYSLFPIPYSLHPAL
ncbi:MULTISPECIES: hypothetical protein [Moorena]|uniref:hypothetical protein n=1 Tax=Moorena TaxID=1155738 RepID=UPI00117C347D|nr:MULTISPECIES: hypothetical protein [Moorena]NEO12624.1 hypothetical protein [Moorena sp. SIO3E8]NEO75526.1 hypothetical protein [Moorena sp. SIO4G3]NEP97664.1 hypothetical protein [Moorena sp. SIO3F7]